MLVLLLFSFVFFDVVLVSCFKMFVLLLMVIFIDVATDAVEDTYMVVVEIAAVVLVVVVVIIMVEFGGE